MSTSGRDFKTAVLCRKQIHDGTSAWRLVPQRCMSEPKTEALWPACPPLGFLCVRSHGQTKQLWHNRRNTMQCLPATAPVMASSVVRAAPCATCAPMIARAAALRPSARVATNLPRRVNSTWFPTAAHPRKLARRSPGELGSRRALLLPRPANAAHSSLASSRPGSPLLMLRLLWGGKKDSVMVQHHCLEFCLCKTTHGV